MGFLQVLWLILKILGILIVSVLGLLLLAVVLLLFVPVRYRAVGHKTGDYGVSARVTWLLHLVHVKLNYDADTKISYEVCIFGRLFLSSNVAWKAANEEKKKKKAEEKAQKQKAKRAKAKAKQKKKKQQTVGKQTQPRTNQPNGKTVVKPILADGNKENVTVSETAENRKKKLFVRIRDKVLDLIRKIKEKCAVVWMTIKRLWQKTDNVVSFLKDETNKAAFGASWTTLVKILKHIGPTRIRGYIAFGMEDPSTTGYILAVLGIFYGKYGKSFSIRPNFEEKMLETELKVKGRIRMSRLLWLAWKLWKNKDFKSLLENIKQLKSDVSTKSNGG